MAADDYLAGLDPQGRKYLEFLRTAPDKGYTVMEIYAGIFSEEERSAHSQEPGGFREKFSEIQGYIDGFCEAGQATKKIVSAAIFYMPVV